MLRFVSESAPECFSIDETRDYDEISTLYPNAVHASHSDGMIPRSWNDFAAWPFALISPRLVDPVAGDGSEDDLGEGSFTGSSAVGVMCVDVVCFTLFDGITSSLSGIFPAFLFSIGGILIVCESL